MKIDTERLIADLNFVKIGKVMRALNWKWQGNVDCPTTAEMKDCIRGLAEVLDRIKGKNYVACGSGGFEVWRCGEMSGVRFIVDWTDNGE